MPDCFAVAPPNRAAFNASLAGPHVEPCGPCPLTPPSTPPAPYPTQMPQVTKEDVIDRLEEISRLLELKGDSIFKIRAYTNAARALETFNGNLEETIRAETLDELSGIGEALAKKITEYVTTGELPYYDQLKAEFPPGLFAMFELQGIGPKKIAVFWKELGITTVQELEAACRDGRIAAVPKMGKKTADNILLSIESQQKHAGSFLHGQIAPAAEAMLAALRDHPDVLQVSIAGSYRRRKEIVRDLDYIVATPEPAAVSEAFVNHPMVQSIIAHGPTKSSVRLENGIQADLRVVTNEQFPFAIAYFTGSKEHNIVIRNRAIARGWTLNEYRLGVDVKYVKKEPEPIPAIHSEADLHRALGLAYIEPELREDRGEFAAAEKNELPDLVEIANLRGTFHNHTTASDGRNSLEEMAEAAQELGLQYLGIADHSRSSVQAHGLHADRLLEQAASIRELNRGYGTHFRLFAGTECDILRDGTLDFPDEVLAQLDYAVGSIHSSFQLSQAEQTKRIIAAITNPCITILGHMTGRILLGREGYPVDVPAILDAAAATGTIVELNASPSRLDMDWRWWPLAREKGVKCSINPDAHTTGSLQFLHFGVGIARKGWLTRKDVVNCLPLGKIEAVLAGKRASAAL